MMEMGKVQTKEMKKDPMMAREKVNSMESMPVPRKAKTKVHLRVRLMDLLMGTKSGDSRVK